MRVLIVSDAPDACATMCGAINQPVLADRAIDGGSALAMIEAATSSGRPFDMVAVAVGLRDMDGFLLLKRVREAQRGAGVGCRASLWLLTFTEAGQRLVETRRGTFDAHVHFPDRARATTPTPRHLPTESSAGQASHCA